ncbi:MAG: ABC transporter permease [Clostridiaceae bacterium]|nr:ABC transporter permease [Clostridiaceae bacterium]
MEHKINMGKSYHGTALVAIFIFMSWSIFILLCGENPFYALYYIVTGAFKSADKIYSVINKLFLFFLTALAFSIPSWTGMFNVGADGQLILGGFCSAALPLFFCTGFSPVDITASLLAAMLAGGLWALWPALLRVYFEISEVVTTLLGNYIIVYFTEYMVNFPLRSKGSSVPRTDYIPESFHFPKLGSGSLSATVIIVIITLAAVELFRRRSVSGYECQVTGQNPFLARQGGIFINSIRIKSMVIGGMLSGLAGGLLVLSLNYTFMAGFSADYGMTGMLVGLIAGNLPVAVLAITGFFAVLQVGAINMQIFTDIPSEITGVLQSIMVFFIAARGSIKFRKAGGGK